LIANLSRLLALFFYNAKGLFMNEKECRSLLSMNIKRYRSRLGLSQLTLASELDISPNFLSDIETGKKWVSPDTLARLANALHIEIYDLFKPQQFPADDITAIVSKYLDDVSLSIEKSVEEAVRQSVKQSLKNVREYYMYPPPGNTTP
jgi:transcriptional regulator with XRE-family HTH domain